MVEQARSLSRQFQEFAQQSAHGLPADADQADAVAGSASPHIGPAVGLGADADVSEEQFGSRWHEADLLDAHENEQAHSACYRTRY